MSEFTKGKWTIEPTGVGDDKMIIGHPNPGEFCVIRTIGRLFTHGTKEENDANARLIAAAPLLYEACKESNRRIAFLLRKIIESKIVIIDRIEIDKTKSCVDFAEAAIAAAEEIK